MRYFEKITYLFYIELRTISWIFFMLSKINLAQSVPIGLNSSYLQSLCEFQHITKTFFLGKIGLSLLSCIYFHYFGQKWRITLELVEFYVVVEQFVIFFVLALHITTKYKRDSLFEIAKKNDISRIASLLNLIITVIYLSVSHIEQICFGL